MSEASRSRIGAGFLAGMFAVGVAAAALPVRAVAAGMVSRREGNVWNWQKHQPRRGGTVAKERAAGVAPPQSRRARLNAEVERLDRRLLSRGRVGTASQAGAATQAGR